MGEGQEDKGKEKGSPSPLFHPLAGSESPGGGKGGYWNGGTWKWNLLGWEIGKEGCTLYTVPAGIILDFESRLGEGKVFVRM